MLVGAVDDRRQPAAQVVAHDPRGRLTRLGAVHGHAEHVRRVDHDDLDSAARTGRERLRLALVLRVDVGQPEPAAAVDVVLPAGAALGGGAHPSDTRRDHYALGALGCRGLDDQAGRQGVHLPHHLGRPCRHHAGAVEDDAGPPERAAEGGSVQDVGLDGRHGHVPELTQPRRVAVRDPNLCTSFGEQPGEVGADEPGCACDCDAHSGVLVRCPLRETSRSWPCFCRHRTDAAP